jgi:hypothetical protein
MVCDGRADLHRLHFGFTITYHYLFPLGLALLILILKTKAVRGNEAANQAVRFWTKVFGITFVMGVITGIRMEFQFGTYDSNHHDHSFCCVRVQPSLSPPGGSHLPFIDPAAAAITHWTKVQ